MTEAERQEAESLKYGNTVIMLIPLSSGRVAVMNAARKIGEETVDGTGYYGLGRVLTICPPITPSRTYPGLLPDDSEVLGLLEKLKGLKL